MMNAVVTRNRELKVEAKRTMLRGLAQWWLSGDRDGPSAPRPIAVNFGEIAQDADHSMGPVRVEPAIDVYCIQCPRSS